MTEDWKWIKGYEGLYQISNLGRVKSFYKDKNDGKIRSVKDSKGWYLTLPLVKEGKKETVRIHQLVAEHFIGDIPKGYHVHHKDENKQNNNVDNLEIISPKFHKILTVKEHPEYVEAMNKYNKFIRPKHIRQYDLEGHFIAEYGSVQIASRITGVCARNISQVADKTPFNSKGSIRKQAGGYVWSYVEESEVV